MQEIDIVSEQIVTQLTLYINKILIIEQKTVIDYNEACGKVL